MKTIYFILGGYFIFPLPPSVNPGGCDFGLVQISMPLLRLINSDYLGVWQIGIFQECTLAEFEYQVEELLFRMNALAGTTNLPEKPTGYLTDSDQSQAVGDDGISSGGSEVSDRTNRSRINTQGS